MTLRRYALALAKLEQATQESDPEVFVTAQDRVASLLQSRVAELAGEGKTVDLPSGGKEVKFGTDALEDPFGWVKSLLDHVNKSKYHPLLRPDSTTPRTIPNGARIALLSDWGTGMYGAPVSAQSILADGTFDVLMHLGDVYYSGTEKETEDRFLKLWPKAAAPLNIALNGNHEMYSGGTAYFRDIFKAFDQASSYCALANDRWLLIGLDTAYVDHAIDAEQAGWVHE